MDRFRKRDFLQSGTVHKRAQADEVDLIPNLYVRQAAESLHQRILDLFQMLRQDDLFQRTASGEHGAVDGPHAVGDCEFR